MPGPYTLSGRLLPNTRYPDRYAVTEALLPIVRRELEALVEAGCREIAVDEPSMSCYAYREDPPRFVDISTARSSLLWADVGSRPISASPMFPALLEMAVDEIHVEMANREYAELEVIGDIARKRDVAVGIIDVKSYFIETPEYLARTVRRCLEFAPADRLAFAPDCGLSQTARWAARQKLKNMVAGVQIVREER